MAPEQVEGRQVAAPADVWALGVIVYEWIAGRRPFARPRPSEEAAAALVGAYAKLTAADRRVDDGLAEIIGRCLATDPGLRPTAAELAAALRGAIDWCAQDDAAIAAERAAVVADPAGYQTRIAPLRIRRLERAAREALDEGRPFAALALCDRGLAYAPDHAGLAALVAEVERATASAGFAATLPGRDRVPSGARPRITGGSVSDSAAPAAPPSGTTSPSGAPPVVTTGGTTTAAAAVASTGVPAKPNRWPLMIAIMIGTVGFATAIVVLAWPHRDHNQAGILAPTTTVTTTTQGGSGADMAEGMAVAKGMLKLFDRAMTADEQKRAAAAGSAAGVPTPTTAAGWLALADRQPAGDAILSVRSALALEPGNQAALDKLCEVLVKLGDRDAERVCVDPVACATGGTCAAKHP
jgi:hypothetical protein